ncbi:MAG: N-6 DNA methylase, partial [Candidatus Poribacteria bacterium]|nr:N-6 DNA methylase [Candidatus Poribacteria bacterium]
MAESTYNNQGLFSTYHLEKVIMEQTSDALESTYDQIKQLYAVIAEFADNLNEPQTEEKFIRPVLEILGHTFAVQPVLRTSLGTKQPDYAFFARQEALVHAHPQINTNAFFKTATAIGDAKAWERELDKKLDGPGDPFSNHNPNYQIDIYIRTSGLTWGILTSGKLWRLYHRDTSYKLDSYYEVDLEKILINEDADAFRYFYYFFRSDAFIPDTSDRSFLDNVLSGSVHYTVSVSDDLGDNIYLALEELINGFLTFRDNNLNVSDTKAIHESCLILLYRLLFVLYAESRGLLPLENREYQSEYSLGALATEIHDKLDNDSTILNILKLKSDYWTRLHDLFTLIDKGWDEHIPQYNGGLFNPTRHVFLEEKKIGNDVLAKVINTLTRTTKRERIAYQDLAIQHLGNIYEGLLQYEPTVQSSPEKVVLTKDKTKRKASGSYYTSDAIVRLMVEDTLGPLCERKTFEKILRLKVLDPAMGSGHFLIGVIDHLALELATHPKAPAMTTGDTDTEIAYWRRCVVENCIYGVDINPMTVELAKVALWLHTVAKGEPLSFLDHHIRCGNSLIGANIADLANLPVLKKSRRANEEIQPVLNMDFGFTDTVSEAVGHYLVIERMEGQTADDIHVMEQKLEQAQQTLGKHKEIADLWLSVHFGNNVARSNYHKALKALASRQTNVNVSTSLSSYRKAQKLAEHYRYFHWEIEFPEVFRDEFGNELENPGFDAIVGNPPYGVKFDSDEKAYLKTVVKETRNMNSAALFIDTAKNRLMKSDGVLAFIVPKSLLFIEKWHSLMFALLEKTRVLIDVGASFKNVKLEQVIFIYDTHYAESFYTARKFIDDAWVMKTYTTQSDPKRFQTWICDVSPEEIQLGLKLNSIGMFMRDLSETKRGLSWQSLLRESGDVPVIGGDNIIRYGTNKVKGFVSSEDLDPPTEKIEFLQKPKVMSQRIIAHIEDPKPHIKITATADQTGDVLSVDTVINTVLTDENFTPIFISAILNSELINWYAHKFIFSSAIRTMDFDNYYVGKIPIPIITPEEQQPIVDLA